MMKNNLTKPFAIIDIGSNSVRCMFVKDGKRDKVTISTRLGEGLSFSTNLLPSAIERTVNAVIELYANAIKRGAKFVYAFATAAVRNSTNGNVFVEEVKRKIDLDIEKINAEKGYFKELDRNELDGNSDHYPFALRNVPCIFFMNEGGEAFKYYHTIYDTWENFIINNYEPTFSLIVDFINGQRSSE